MRNFLLSDKVRKNPYMQAINHPEIYLKKMIQSTLIIGCVVFIINWIYINTSMHSVKIPNGIHAMLGFVIAMLLVFRTNTAYERWWDGRKKIQELKTCYANILCILDSINSDSNTSRFTLYSVEEIRQTLKKHLSGFKNFLKDENAHFTLKKTDTITQLLKLSKNEKFTPEERGDLRKQILELNAITMSCERIKTTPIPMAYTIHVKLCIFIYIATLPFSMFYDLNLWSTPIVMVLYFIISGTEIIANEIENPFQGEANDLPVDNLTDEIKNLL